MSLTEKAATGNRLEALKALRDTLAETIEGTDSGRDVAALSQRLMDVMAEIETIEKAKNPSGGKRTPLDRFIEKQARRAR